MARRAKCTNDGVQGPERAPSWRLQAGAGAGALTQRSGLGCGRGRRRPCPPTSQTTRRARAPGTRMGFAGRTPRQPPPGRLQEEKKKKKTARAARQNTCVLAREPPHTQEAAHSGAKASVMVPPQPLLTVALRRKVVEGCGRAGGGGAEVRAQRTRARQAAHGGLAAGRTHCARRTSM